MIRTLLTTTAMVALLGSAVIAQDLTPQPAPVPQPVPTPMAPAPAPTSTVPAIPGLAIETWDISRGYLAVTGDVRASDLIGAPVYSSNLDTAEQIGTVSDVVLATDGSIRAVILGVGGFLGLGEKLVAVDFSAFEYMVATDNTERWVLPTTRELLESAPEFAWSSDRVVMR